MSAPAVTTTATLTGEGGEYFFIVPIDFQATFGRHRPPVRVTIRGHTFRTTPARYGGEYYVVVNRANREAIGIDRGDRVKITFELDTEPRVVKPPPELAASLRDSTEARSIYNKLAYSHQKAYADWVTEAKRPATRVRRADESVKRLLAGRKEPNG